MAARSSMTSRWHIGAKDLRGAIAAYAKRFNLLEVKVTLGSPTSPDGPGFSPGLATLRRWRKSVPPHFDFAVVAGPALSRAKAGDAADRELAAAARPSTRCRRAASCCAHRPR